MSIINRREVIEVRQFDFKAEARAFGAQVVPMELLLVRLLMDVVFFHSANSASSKSNGKDGLYWS